MIKIHDQETFVEAMEKFAGVGHGMGAEEVEKKGVVRSSWETPFSIPS
jgi:hypothetical protein